MLKVLSIFIALNAGLIGCQTSRKLDLPSDAIDTNETDKDDMPWRDLDVRVNEQLFTPEQDLEELDRVLGSSDPQRGLMSLAQSLNLARPKLLGAGVCGRTNDTFLYVTTWDRLQHSPDRAYWDLVRVLSQRYGCLMRKQLKTRSAYIFTCKDRRQVTLRPISKGQHFLIVGTQKDRFGRDLYVQR